MNHQTRNAALALVGLLALSIYILACTSFSPDDTKVLYPSFDAASGSTGIAVYDRVAHSSEMLCVPVGYEASDTNAQVSPAVLRAGWLSDGREVAIAYVGTKDDDKAGLTVAVMAWAGRKPVRMFRVPSVKDVGETLIVPLCLVRDRLFLRASDKGILRLDLRSGALAAKEFDDAKGEIAFYPAPDGASVFYLEADAPSAGQTTFGRLNPGDFSRTPFMVVSNALKEMTAVAYDKDGKVLALLAGGEDKAGLQVWRDGKQVFSREVETHGHKRTFGNAMLAASGTAVRASFQQANGTNSTSYGLIEIPFSDAPVREVMLIKDAPPQDDSSAYYFQMAVSHDGKTAAVASTYLALMEKPINAADCALFLVDLSDPSLKVTKVPIPLPPKVSAVLK